MAKLSGRDSKGQTVYMAENGYWTTDSKDAAQFTKAEAERKLRIINANNRFLDAEDRVNVTLKG